GNLCLNSRGSPKNAPKIPHPRYLFRLVARAMKNVLLVFQSPVRYDVVGCRRAGAVCHGWSIDEQNPRRQNSTFIDSAHGLTWAAARERKPSSPARVARLQAAARVAVG